MHPTEVCILKLGLLIYQDIRTEYVQMCDMTQNLLQHLSYRKRREQGKKDTEKYIQRFL